MSKVYVVQDQLRKNKDNGRLERRFDLSPAGQFGELVYLLGSSASPFNSGHIIDQLRTGLGQYSDEDYLLLIGNPVLIGWAVAIAADVNGGFVRCLQWSGKDQKYIAVNGTVFPDCEDEEA